MLRQSSARIGGNGNHQTRRPSWLIAMGIGTSPGLSATIAWTIARVDSGLLLAGDLEALGSAMRDNTKVQAGLHPELVHADSWRAIEIVTPKDVQGYAPFSNKEGATVATTSFLLQWTLQKAIQRLRETKDGRARAAARQEVIDALNAPDEAHAKAGLPRR